MTPKEYKQIKDPDIALAVRLAVTMGWKVELHSVFEAVQVYDRNDNGHQGRYFNPFTDASIPYGLIGHGKVTWLHSTEDGALYGAWADKHGTTTYQKTKTHAILNAYCQADPMGHWADFIGEKE